MSEISPVGQTVAVDQCSQRKYAKELITECMRGIGEPGRVLLRQYLALRLKVGNIGSETASG